MGDQDHRHAVLGLEILDQVEDLRLHGDVERRRRLVGDQHVGAVGERHGDHHALALAARHLVRILLAAAPPARGSALPRAASSARAIASLRRHLVVQVEDLAELLADRIDRVQRAHRLLEDHRDVVAAQLAHLALSDMVEDVLAVERDARLLADRGALGQEPHERARRHRLARAALADERDGLALVELERDVAHGVDDAALDLEVDGDVAGIEDQLAAVRAEVVPVVGSEGCVLVSVIGCLNRGRSHRAGRRPAR